MAAHCYKQYFNNIKFWVQKLGMLRQLIYSVRLPQRATSYEKFVVASILYTEHKEHVGIAHDLTKSLVVIDIKIVVLVCFDVLFCKISLNIIVLVGFLRKSKY